MGLTGSNLPTSPEASRPASVRDLEAELSGLWRELAEGAETRHGVMRACALTLLVFVETEEASEEVKDSIRKVSLASPCRAVVMIAEAQAPAPELTAWTSIYCHLPVGGEKQVCCEQIVLRARGEAVRELDNVVLPLTVAALPVVLWWRADRCPSAERLGALARIADRALIDSARFPDPPADLLELARLAEGLEGQTALRDLNWTRAAGWRELIASLFDSPETRPCLESLSEVTMQFAAPRQGGAGQEAQSLMLAAWLAARLSWKPAGRTSSPNDPSRPFRFSTPQGKAQVSIRSRGGAASEAPSFSIRLESTGAASANFSLAGFPESRTARVSSEVGGRAPVTRVAPLALDVEADLVSQELGRAGRDPIFEEALRMAAQMLSS